MNSWDIASLEVSPRSPQIISSTDDSRAIVLQLPAGESLPDHQVHERAWVVVIEGEVEIASSSGETASGGAGLVVELAAAERHSLTARRDARLLLLLVPWPGDGHPGAMSLEDKATVHDRAAQRNGG